MADQRDEGGGSAATAADEARRHFVCPPAHGRYDEIELEYLDPADPDECRMLIESEHPELHRALRTYLAIALAVCLPAGAQGALHDARRARQRAARSRVAPRARPRRLPLRPHRAARAHGRSFWDMPTLDELAEEQGIEPVERLEDLVSGFWPEDESVDDFLAAIESRD